MSAFAPSLLFVQTFHLDRRILELSMEPGTWNIGQD